MSLSYKNAGVDINAGYESVKLIKPIAERTHNKNVLSGIGGFGGLFQLDLTEYHEPVLVSGTDGVGTKVIVASMIGRLDTIGIDCVAMCVNDIVCSGAKPVYFLDYLAVNKNRPERVAEIVEGVARGCEQAGCALIGGETAEMPSLYGTDMFDVAGFAVGVVEKSKIIDGSKVREGDVLIGITSSGVHTNGFALVRKAFGIRNGSWDKLERKLNGLDCLLGDELLKPTKIYVKPTLELIEKCDVHGVSHITGGGFYENVPRMLPDNYCARINLNTFTPQAIFDIIKNNGNISEDEMYNIFNMGIGMVIALPAEQRDAALDILAAHGETGAVIGNIVTDDQRKVILCRE